VSIFFAENHSTTDQLLFRSSEHPFEGRCRLLFNAPPDKIYIISEAVFTGNHLTEPAIHKDKKPSCR